MTLLNRRAMLVGAGTLAATAMGVGLWRGLDARSPSAPAARRVLWPDLRPAVDASALQAQLQAQLQARLRGETVAAAVRPEVAPAPVGSGLITAQIHEPGFGRPQASDWVDGRALDTSPAADAPFAWDQQAARLEDLVTSLQGERIALPGYSVPLDLERDGTRVFLLAPYVGACIHVPPPPPNQIVLVTTETPYVFETMFEAIVVTGEMLVEPTGTRLAEVGYQIVADAVRPFDPGSEAEEWLNGYAG